VAQENPTPDADTPNSDEDIVEPEGEAEPTPAPGPQADWLEPGRFRTAEDLRQAYRHLEGEYTRARQAELALQERLQAGSQDSEEVDDLGEDDDFVTVAQARQLRAELAELKKDVVSTRQSTGTSHLEVFRQLKRTDPYHDVVAPRFEQLAAQFPPEALADPRALDALWTQARGASTDDLIRQAEERGKQGAARTRQQASRMGTGGGPRMETGLPQLSKAQKDVAQALGVSEDAYAKRVKEMEEE